MRSSWRMLAVALGWGAGSMIIAGAAHAGIALKLTSPQITVAPGDTLVVQAEIVSEDSTFNAFDLVVRFDPAMVAYVPASPQAAQIGSLMTGACANVFHVFNAAADSTVADVALLCSQTFVTGPGTIYQLKFKSNGTSGVAKFSVGRGSRFLKAGVYVNPILPQGVSMVVGNVLAAPRGELVPPGVSLESPRPNPWHAGSTALVRFTLPWAARVELVLFDMQGRSVATHAAGVVPAGASSVRWASPGLPAGRYELRLRADGNIIARQGWVLLR